MAEQDIIAEYRSMSRLWTLRSCLEDTTFYSDPASSRYHCNYYGGLAEHSLNVEVKLLFLTKKMKLIWKDRESPYIIALAHDVCKVGAYLPDGSGGYIKNPNHPTGHGELSVQRVKRYIDLTEEEEACIRWHMGAFVDDGILDFGKEYVHDEWNAFTDAAQKFPNVLWTHAADLLAALNERRR